MQFDFPEAFKVILAVIGGILVVYEVLSRFTSNAPLLQVVNPHRRQLLMAGSALISSGYSLLAIYAGNKWALADVLTVIAPLFNEQPTPLKVIAIVFLCVVGGGLLAGSALFCFVVYPRDPKSFTPTLRTPAAIRFATDVALRHYTTQRGGLEYAALIVLPANGSIPSVDQLVATIGTPYVSGYYLIECFDRRDARTRDKENEKQRATRQELERRAGVWLAHALEAQVSLRDLERIIVAHKFGEVCQTRIRSIFGGMMFERLLPAKSGEPDYLLFGVTTSSDEMSNGRLELHFGMLKETLSYIIKSKSDIGQASVGS